MRIVHICDPQQHETDALTSKLSKYSVRQQAHFEFLQETVYLNTFVWDYIARLSLRDQLTVVQHS